MTVIAIDGRHIYRDNRRGTGKNLIDLYRRVASMRPDWQFIVFHQICGPDDPLAGLPNVIHHQMDIPGDRFDFWQQIRLPLAAVKARADLLHCPANFSPRFPLVPMIVTIHDLIPLEPAFSTLESPKWVRKVSHAARIARRIVTPSYYTRDKIVQSFGLKADKIIVNHWAPDERCRKVSDPAELNRTRVKYGLKPDQPYVFGFGAADPRKNTSRVLDAWHRLADRLKRDFALLLVGIQEPVLAKLRSRVRDSGEEKSCFLFDFADEQDIPALISGATVLCYPSLSEGFGLPILDAFVCETAVLTADATALPEVAGDAARLVNPWDPDDIANGLSELLDDVSLRQSLIERGRSRLPMFTWTDCAKRFCGILDDVLGVLG